MPDKPSLARLAPVVGAGVLLLAIPTAWAVADTTPSTVSTSGDRVMRLNWTITEIREGDVTATLAEIVREFGAELLVVGAHGERPDHARTLGSTAQHLVDAAEVPVLLVGGDTSVDPVRILVPLDRSAAAPEALRWAFAVQYPLWALGAVQILRHRRRARRAYGGRAATVGG